MSSVCPLTEETELARVQGKRMATPFSTVATLAVLTNKRVYQVSGEGAQEESTIIPLRSVDSFGLVSTSKTWLLVLGLLLGACGLYSLATSQEKGGALLLLLIGVVLIVAWWRTMKVGAVVHSFSGKSEIFVQASAANSKDLANFIVQIQEILLRSRAPSWMTR